MNTSVCIDTNKGRDCLEFTKVGTGPGTRWSLQKISSRTRKTKRPELGSGRMVLGEFLPSGTTMDQRL